MKIVDHLLHCLSTKDHHTFIDMGRERRERERQASINKENACTEIVTRINDVKRSSDM